MGQHVTVEGRHLPVTAEVTSSGVAICITIVMPLEQFADWRGGVLVPVAIGEVQVCFRSLHFV